MLHLDPDDDDIEVPSRIAPARYGYLRDDDEPVEVEALHMEEA